MKPSKTVSVILLLGILLPAASVLQGCLAGTHGSVIAPERKAAIVRGKTTKEELLRALGTPDEVVNLGGGREELSYVRETVTAHTTYIGLGTSAKTQFWIILHNNVVEAFGDRSTDRSPNYMKWLF